MPAASELLLEASLDLAWSHWVGLGVRGTAQPPSSAVDPEGLLYFTACLVDHDPRLRDEVGDWWHRFHGHVSRPRLTALASRFGEPAVSRFKALEKSWTLARHTSAKSRLDHLQTPARSLLRFRCVFGANARAEVLLEMLTRRGKHDEGLTALALSEVGYSKRNVAFILDDLALAGVISPVAEGNRVRYRLVDPAGLAKVCGPIPAAPGRWHHRLPVLAAFVELAVRIKGRDAVVQGIEARKCLDRMMPRIAALGVPRSAPAAIAQTYWPSLQRWLVDNLIAELADGERGIPGMIEGVWVRASQDAHRPQRFSSAVLPRLAAGIDAADQIHCLDLVQVPTVEPAGEWVWAVMSTAATSTYTHTIGLDNRERWRFVTWSFGEERTYSAEYDEPVPHDRIARLYGKAAAARARSDQPAIQLRLRRG